MRKMTRLLMLSCLSGTSLSLLPFTHASTSATANSFPVVSMKEFWTNGVKEGDNYWQGDHWKTDNGVHASTQMYMTTAYTVATGDKSRMDHVYSHYRYILPDWNEEAGCFWNPGSYMTQACIALTFALTLEEGRAVLEPAVATDMEAKLRRLCVGLSRSGTSLVKDDDLRACNQDAVAAAALSLAGELLDNPEIRGWGHLKLLQILNASSGPFWTEGGVDISYQGVGESSFAMAADLQWDNLSAGQKRRVMDLLMRPLATQGLNLEAMRSESNLSMLSRPVASRASSMTGRVGDPYLAWGVRQTFEDVRGMKSRFWLFDTPTMTFYRGVKRNAGLLENMPLEAVPPGWGGQAELTMHRSEFQWAASTDEKTFITSENTLVAMFADISRQHPDYPKKKRNLAVAPKQFNAGGLRYIGKGGRVFVWADAEYGFPRVWQGGEDDADNVNGAPLRLLTEMQAGYFGSQYHLSQSVRPSDGENRALVTQRFAVLGDMVLLILEADGELSRITSPRYALTVPVKNAVSTDGPMLAWDDGTLINGNDVRRQALIAADGGMLRLVAANRKAYLANERMRIWVDGGQRHASPTMPLSQAEIPLVAGGRRWALLCCDGDAVRWEKLQKSILLEQDDAGGVLQFRDGERDYVVVLDRKESGKSAVRRVGVGANQVGFVGATPGRIHCAVIEKGALVGAMFQGTEISWNGQTIARAAAAKAIAISLLKRPTGWFVSVEDGPAMVDPAGLRSGVTGTGLLDGSQLNLKNALDNDRVWIP
ncbi:hypothetical protein OPIT5_24295 [Opitutaceae bacterium TAV5]|nr:hypothetical protein OPIT5_24295 [Opitutaceae bacterium TAV5]